MYHVETEFSTGEDKTREFKSLFGACQWLMSQRGVESVMIEKCVDAPSLDLEGEFDSLMEATR